MLYLEYVLINLYIPVRTCTSSIKKHHVVFFKIPINARLSGGYVLGTIFDIPYWVTCQSTNKERIKCV